MPSRNVQCVYCHFPDGPSKRRPVRLPRPIQCVTTLKLSVKRFFFCSFEQKGEETLVWGLWATLWGPCLSLNCFCRCFLSEQTGWRQRREWGQHLHWRCCGHIPRLVTPSRVHHNHDSRQIPKTLPEKPAGTAIVFSIRKLSPSPGGKRLFTQSVFFDRPNFVKTWTCVLFVLSWTSLDLLNHGCHEKRSWKCFSVWVWKEWRRPQNRWCLTFPARRQTRSRLAAWTRFLQSFNDHNSLGSLTKPRNLYFFWYTYTCICLCRSKLRITEVCRVQTFLQRVCFSGDTKPSSQHPSRFAWAPQHGNCHFVGRTWPARVHSSHLHLASHHWQHQCARYVKIVACYLRTVANFITANNEWERLGFWRKKVLRLPRNSQDLHCWSLLTDLLYWRKPIIL